jgi:hypothetical protein
MLLMPVYFSELSFACLHPVCKACKLEMSFLMLHFRLMVQKTSANLFSLLGMHNRTKS